MKTQEFIFEKSNMITSRARELSFLIKMPFAFKAGQFMNVYLDDKHGKKSSRSYSIVSSPRNFRDSFKMIYTHRPGGLISEYFLNLQIGDAVNMSGPHGKFVLHHPEAQKTRFIWVATGTGIGPFCSMLPEAVELAADHYWQILIYFGVRTPSDLLYADWLREYANKYPLLKLHFCYSQLFPDQPKNDEYKGRISALLYSLNISTRYDKLYLCGHPEMVDEIHQVFLQKGLDNRSIFREKYLVRSISNLR